MESDTRQKLAEYIDKSVKIRETFFFAHPVEKIEATERYCSSLFGSVLWNLDSDASRSVYSAWKIGVKLAWEVDRRCHTYLLQSVLASHSISLRVRLLSRFLKFFQSLLSSPSKEVSVAARIAARDIRTNLGSNLDIIKRESKLDPWESDRQSVQTALHFAELKEIPKEDEWRCEYLGKLLNERLQHSYEGNKNEESEIMTLIDSLVVN